MAHRTIVVVSHDGQVIGFHGGTGFEAQSWRVDAPLSDLWLPLMRDEVASVLARTADGDAVEDLPIVSADERRFGVSVYPLGHGQIGGHLVLVLAPLDTIEAVPADSLTAMAGALAHELRNPLAGIRAALEQVGRQLAASHRLLIDEVMTRIDAMDGLLDELLMFASSPTPQVEPLALPALLDDVVNSLANRSVPTFQVSCLGTVPPVRGDEAMLRAAFLNLLMNAVQANQGDEPIGIVVEGRPDSVSIAIVDHGSGFSTDARSAMFRPFFTTKARGTGLGLPNARRLIEAHGGRLTVESRPTGSRVVVTLPVAGADTAAPKSPQPAAD